MKAVILAGGFGTRISEETFAKPKPMIEIGGRPILWHIMKIYSYYGINDFIICCGYKGFIIKEYFANYFHNNDLKVNFKNNNIQILNNNSEPWQITLIDTGENTMTGGRLLRVKEYLSEEESFCFTYGDGLGNIEIDKQIKFHKSSKKIATLTVTRPSGRFGIVHVDGNEALNFKEKNEGENNWINSGFFILSKRVFDYLDDDQTIWEEGPLNKLAKNKQLGVWKHDGFGIRWIH